MRRPRTDADRRRPSEWHPRNGPSATAPRNALAGCPRKRRIEHPWTRPTATRPTETKKIRSPARRRSARCSASRRATSPSIRATTRRPTTGSCPNRHAYRSYVDGIYMGHKWQCVEFARRWLYLNTGWIFDDVGDGLRDLRADVGPRREARTRGCRCDSFRNGSRRPPEPGCLLIWDEGGEFERTGHVAIVVEVCLELRALRRAERRSPPLARGPRLSRARSRRRAARRGEFWLECSFADATILGWVIQTDDDTDAVPIDEPDPELFTLIDRARSSRDERTQRAWLNVANPDEAAFVELMGGHYLSDRHESQDLYFLHLRDAPTTSSSGRPTSSTRSSCTPPTTCCATTRCSSASASRAPLAEDPPVLEQPPQPDDHRALRLRDDRARPQGLRVQLRLRGLLHGVRQGPGQVGRALSAATIGRDSAAKRCTTVCATPGSRATSTTSLHIMQDAIPRRPITRSSCRRRMEQAGIRAA